MTRHCEAREGRNNEDAAVRGGAPSGGERFCSARLGVHGWVRIQWATAAAAGAGGGALWWPPRALGRRQQQHCYPPPQSEARFVAAIAAAAAAREPRGGAQVQHYHTRCPLACAPAAAREQQPPRQTPHRETAPCPAPHLVSCVPAELRMSVAPAACRAGRALGRRARLGSCSHRGAAAAREGGGEVGFGGGGRGGEEGRGSGVADGGRQCVRVRVRAGDFGSR